MDKHRYNVTLVDLDTGRELALGLYVTALEATAEIQARKKYASLFKRLVTRKWEVRVRRAPDRTQEERMEATFKKIDSNLWICEDIEEHPTLMRLSIGKVISVAARLIRSVAYHRRFFKMLDFAFDWWEAPDLEWRGQPVRKNKERFRKDVMILAGYGDPVVNIRGEVRMEARSMSFAKMDQDEFEALYSACFDVCLDKVLGRNREADLARAVDDFMHFA